MRHMDRLEAKKVNGQTYYYYSKWGWKNGKCRRLWQKYLGKPEKILKAIRADNSAGDYAEVFEWGLSGALWKECVSSEIVEIIDELCPKREQGLSTGEYISLASINRSIQAVSKASIWDWFSKTTLIRNFKGATKSALSSQRFWDHMDRISKTKTREIWRRILSNTVASESIDTSSISYDGTNFYTFIDTFNVRCDIAKRGKNKQGRSNLRQVSYALFCTADSHIPLYYDVYDGNRHDAKQFSAMLSEFHSFWETISHESGNKPDTTVVFDKGNNSARNFEMIDRYELNYVGSVKLGEHKELVSVSNEDDVFKDCSSSELAGVKAFRVAKNVYGKTRTLVVTFNPNLHQSQYMTLQNDISKALLKLSDIQQKLEDRRQGLVTKGTKPTTNSTVKKCSTALKRPYLASIIKVDVDDGDSGIPKLDYSICNDTLDNITKTYLGKNILITSRAEWDIDRIITAYRSQYIIEDVFKEMKDRDAGSWWPMHHWTDSKIHVHALYCTIALLLRALIQRRVQKDGIRISMKRLLTSLRDIKEVVTVNTKEKKKRTTLTKLDEIQERLLDSLSMQHDPMVLG
jgi:transposase